MSNDKAIVEQFTDRQKLEAAYALNLCTVSVSQIVDYNDIYILEQEYDAILNNLNIQNIIHDEAMLSVLKKILDTITFFKIQEEDKKFIEKEYQAKMKNAIWSAVPNLSVIITGGNPITTAIGIATQIGIGYMSYRKTKSTLVAEKEKQEWELMRSAIEQFAALQRELFETAWRLSDRYDFDDRLRLTEKQIKQYNQILIDPDPLRRYERLDTKSSIFEAFPPFWYYKGNAAKEVAAKYKNNNDIMAAYTAKALENYRKFDEIYVELMREDLIAASCALEHIALLDNRKDVDEIKKLLDRAMRLAGDNSDVLQIAVLNYISLGQHGPAKEILRRLVNENYNVSLNGLLLSRIYCKWDKNKVEYDILHDRIGEKNVIPWIENDVEADKKYIESRQHESIVRFNQFMEQFTLKYRDKYYQTVAYNKALKLQNQLDWCLNTDITQVLIDTLNEYFSYLSSMELFAIQKRNNNLLWKDFFDDQALVLFEKVKGFYDIQMRVKNRVTEISKKITFSSFGVKKGSENEINHENLKKAIKVYNENSDFNKITANFIVSIKDEFIKSLTVESLVNLQDNMINILAKWYTENGIEIPSIYQENGEVSTQAIAKQEVFFGYPDLVSIGDQAEGG
jgi:hypothetical protein